MRSRRSISVDDEAWEIVKKLAKKHNMSVSRFIETVIKNYAAS